MNCEYDGSVVLVKDAGAEHNYYGIAVPEEFIELKGIKPHVQDRKFLFTVKVCGTVLTRQGEFLDYARVGFDYIPICRPDAKALARYLDFLHHAWMVEGNGKYFEQVFDCLTEYLAYLSGKPILAFKEIFDRAA